MQSKHLAALNLIIQAEEKVANISGPLGIAIRSKEFSALEKLAMLQAQAADKESNPLMVRVFGEELITNILNFEL